MGRVHFLDLLAQSDLGQVAPGPRNRLSLRQTEHVDRRFNNVFERGQMKPKVEVLKDHRQLNAHPAQFARIGNDQFLRPVSFQPDRLIIQDVSPSVWPFEKIETTKKGTLSRAA